MFWDSFGFLLGYFQETFQILLGKDGKCNNVSMMFLGKNLCKIIHCFVKKVSSVRILCFVGNSFGNFRLLNGIFWHILQHYVSFWPFLHCLGLFGFLRSFVKNKI
jgi:hypothetical protein